MLKCPVCNAETKVYYSWLTKAGIRNRRYLCPHGHRFTSTEQVIRVNPNTSAQPLAYNGLATKVVAS